MPQGIVFIFVGPIMSNIFTRRTVFQNEQRKNLFATSPHVCCRTILWNFNVQNDCITEVDNRFFTVKQNY